MQSSKSWLKSKVKNQKSKLEPVSGSVPCHTSHPNSNSHYFFYFLGLKCDWSVSLSWGVECGWKATTVGRGISDAAARHTSHPNSNSHYFFYFLGLKCDWSVSLSWGVECVESKSLLVHNRKIKKPPGEEASWNKTKLNMETILGRMLKRLTRDFY